MIPTLCKRQKNYLAPYVTSIQWGTFILLIRSVIWTLCLFSEFVFLFISVRPWSSYCIWPVSTRNIWGGPELAQWRHSKTIWRQAGTGCRSGSIGFNATQWSKFCIKIVHSGLMKILRDKDHYFNRYVVYVDRSFDCIFVDKIQDESRSRVWVVSLQKILKSWAMSIMQWWNWHQHHYVERFF